MDNEINDWLKARSYTPDQLETARRVLEEIRRGKETWQATRRHPLPGGGYLAKHILVEVYRQMVAGGELQPDDALLARIRMKPIRTLSGVTTVTVLTKEYPCPGDCIFCPTEARMPKSYLSDEPGARRGLQHAFDPFAQVSGRLRALASVGHPTDKIELLILGGTWSAYKRDYQEWFVRRCFDALNGVESKTLEEAHHLNETSAHRNVGLVIETRPDEVTPEELAWLRRLGVTKVQMGAQSLDERILALNRRGHTAAQTLSACTLLRAAGFKIVLHWMPNLLGATLKSDRSDFARLWREHDPAASDPAGYCPDEIKIYPCQLLANAELYQYWQRGEYTPYTEAELLELVVDIKPSIPRYCRVNRVVRDIPSTNVVAGSKRTSLRQDAQAELARRGQKCSCLRCREVRGQAVDPASLALTDQVYHPAEAEEHFLSFVTPDDRVAGFLRLSLPRLMLDDANYDRLNLSARKRAAFPDLAGAAIIREVHVYGQSLAVGEEKSGAAQHVGLGTRLIEQAASIARDHGYPRLAVIAAIGTRKYYESRGFTRGELYMTRPLTTD